jgi:hypothetical protein
VCDANVAEMQKLLTDAGYELPIPLENHPSSTEPVQTDAMDDRTIPARPVVLHAVVHRVVAHGRDVEHAN